MAAETPRNRKIEPNFPEFVFYCIFLLPFSKAIVTGSLIVSYEAIIISH
jgi:hypothetical protein